MAQRAQRPFTFIECSELRELLGRQAWDERELAEVLEEAPLDSVYYHTHSFVLRHSHLAMAYPNDFADWVATQVRDRALAERLAAVDPFDMSGLEALREELISIIDDHLSRMAVVPRVMFGEPFHFKQSRILEVPTARDVWTLQDFRDAIADIEASALYYHMFEARVRLGRPDNDFSLWVREELGVPELADRIRKINPYLGSLERLRSWLLELCDEFLARPQAGA